MKNDYTIWKIFGGYLTVLLFLIMTSTVNAQSPCSEDGICVVQFNASFNDANKVAWVNKLTDCDTKFIDIASDTKAAGKYKIVVVPSIVIYKGGEEVHRFQANIMMQMDATRKDVQSVVDEIIYSDF